MLLKIAKMVISEEPDGKYLYVLQELQEAVNDGVAGGDCSKYVCGAERREY